MPKTADLLEEIAALKAMLIAADARDKRKAEHGERLEAKARHKLDHLKERTQTNTPAEVDRKRAVIQAALDRARARRG